MFKFLTKEKKAPAVSNETPVLSGIVSSDHPPAYETGKETMIQDPKTGQFIYRRPLSPDHRKLIMDAFQKNAMAAQAYLSISRQRDQIVPKVKIVEDELTQTEKNIHELFTKIRDEMKLDRQWEPNIALGVIERREPPHG